MGSMRKFKATIKYSLDKKFIKVMSKETTEKKPLTKEQIEEAKNANSDKQKLVSTNQTVKK